ncbi:TetR/AcrR family transcriptional regulator [Companilactobacillus ginsenosidimutans]|uniref:AcrR family transcriptional regulator n=1 Tax=Companilactobacillus ginsenosidimutans TaxID=1007676 RepID=A0A0H4QKP6_9LACO|nr:helix-turn-helix domain-containing protein [Companilactobacillus ginsenosidimutans]AKP67671.1 AcrR family transcriptional regulator [Companilactobacillus ginsenosidimutans]
MAQRRRGKELEDAILTATWQLLQTTGYSEMTMDDIANTAKTNKNAIYRRWKTKLEVTVEAIKKFSPVSEVFASMKAPDNGNLHDDLVELMDIPLTLIKPIGLKNIKGALRDALPNISKANAINYRKMTDNNILTKSLMTILKNAYRRSEIKTEPEKFTDTVKNMPIMLLISRIVSEEDYDQSTVLFFVEKILIPVFAAQ